MRQSPNDCPHLSQVPLSVVRPRAGTVSCATRTSPHSEQRLPSVSPVFVQVSSTAGITSSTWVCLSVLPLLVFPPLVFPAFPPPQATRGSVIATASKIVVNFFIFCLPFVVFIFAVHFPHRQILPSARSKQGFFLLRKQLVIDLPQGQLMDHAITDNGVPSGAGIQLDVAPPASASAGSHPA